MLGIAVAAVVERVAVGLEEVIAAAVRVTFVFVVLEWVELEA